MSRPPKNPLTELRTPKAARPGQLDTALNYHLLFQLPNGLSSKARKPLRSTSLSARAAYVSGLKIMVEVVTQSNIETMRSLLPEGQGLKRGRGVGDVTLRFCPKCCQMTNHKDKRCGKCGEINGILNRGKRIRRYRNDVPAQI